MEIKTGDANQITKEYFDRILIEQRLIDSVVPSLDIELFGKVFSSPIMMPAFSHLKPMGENRENGLVEYAKAAKSMNLVNWIGMIENEQLQDVLDVNVPTIRIIKPYADKKKIFSQLEYAELNGAFAVGMDIDHIFGNNGYDVCVGEQMMKQTIQDLKAYVEYTHLPFIVKGVLSVEDAIKCGEIGVSGIVISHHHGRMPYAIPPLMILPDIVKAVKEKYNMKIFVDCGVDTGSDAFKCLCLGADAVCVGRAMMPALKSKGTEGVEEYMNLMNKQLALLMGCTGFSNIEKMNSDVLWDKLLMRRLSE